jgi:hypothetical protein
MRQRLTIGPLTAIVEERWIEAANKRCSADDPRWTTRPTIHALAIESVKVEEPNRRQGHFKRFLAGVCADPRFDMIVVEGVGNRHLAEYLLREGWEVDVGVMDFYKVKNKDRTLG